MKIAKPAIFLITCFLFSLPWRNLQRIGYSLCEAILINERCNTKLLFEWDVLERNHISGPCTLWWPLQDAEIFHFDLKHEDIELEINIHCSPSNYSYSGVLYAFGSAIEMPEFISTETDWTIAKAYFSPVLIPAKNRLNVSLQVLQKPINSNGKGILVSSFTIQIKLVDWTIYDSISENPNHRDQSPPILTAAQSLMMSRPREDLAYLLNTLNLTGLAAEIGVDQAVFSESFLNRWKGRRYIMIDPWKYFSNTEYLDSTNALQEKCDMKYKESQDRMSRFGDRAIFLRMTSLDAAQLIADGVLDFVYIDARHDYFDLMMDMMAWWPKLKNGGILAGHDFQISQVRYAVLEFSRKMNIIVHRTYDTYPSWYIFKL